MGTAAIVVAGITRIAAALVISLAFRFTASRHNRGLVGARRGDQLILRIALFVKTRVKGIEVFGVQVFLCNAKRIPEALEMYEFTLAQESNGIFHIWVVHETQNIIIGKSGLLFGSEVLIEICKGISGDLESAGGEWHSRRCLRINAGGVIYKISIKSAPFDLFGF